MTVVIVVLVAVGAVLVAALLTRAFFNSLSPRIDRHRRAHDDDYFFNQCRSGMMTRYRSVNRRLPASPRCKLCAVPFGGVGRVVGIKPSRKNPNFCMGCFEMAPMGGHDMEVGVLFADIRGFTSWCEHHTPEEAERVLNQFYEAASEALTRRDALVDKLVGDEVMGLFLSAFPSLGTEACETMVECAETILRDPRIAGNPDLGIGIGLSFGTARVGNVGAGGVKDFTAVGDVVNTAARLQAVARAGEIVMSAAVYAAVRVRYPSAATEAVPLKGKELPVEVHTVRPA